MASPQSGARPVNRPAITACVILSVIMQALDTTIANVALPYIQGSVSASADQINWVLTSYIVAAAIMTPPSGFLASKFGRQRVLLVAIAGFVVASVLCGIAQSLPQIVAFRLLQGFLGAALVPIAQSILLDIYSARERGSAMALFGVSVMVGPFWGRSSVAISPIILAGAGSSTSMFPLGRWHLAASLRFCARRRNWAAPSSTGSASEASALQSLQCRSSSIEARSWIGFPRWRS